MLTGGRAKPAGWRWAGGPGGVIEPRLPARLVVVAPHPDDEVLGAAGVMTWAVAHGAELVVAAVTDGEASHRWSRVITAAELVERRRQERDAALGCLGLDPVIERLGLPDAAVADHEDDLARALAELIGPGTTLLAPYRHDGHPDHEASYRAAAAAARTAGIPLWEVPIWARVEDTFPADPAHRLHLGTRLRQRKQAAVAEFRSQLDCLGTTHLDGPIVPPEAVDVLTGPVEILAGAA